MHQLHLAEQPPRAYRNETPGRALARRLRDGGYSVTEFASEIGVSRQAVHKWLADESMPTLAHLHRMSDILNVPIPMLLWSMPVTLDRTLLINVVTAVDDWLRRNRRELTAEKRTQLYTILYNECVRGRHSVSEDRLDELASLAA